MLKTVPRLSPRRACFTQSKAVNNHHLWVSTRPRVCISKSVPILQYYFSSESAPGPSGSYKHRYKHHYKRHYKRYYVFGGLVGSFVGLYAFSSDFRDATRHTYYTADRVSTVLGACFRCFRLYYVTLNGSYDSPEAYELALSQCHLKSAEITRKAIERNGGIFIKLGQHISALTYIFPEEWTSSMISLQDKCPTSSIESIRELIKEDTGKTMDDLFESFDETPLGTASLAQVHVAVLKGSDTPSEKVAVKVQHPSLKEFVPIDVLLTRTVFNLIDFFFPDYPLSWLSDELKTSIFVELDFREEAKNAKKTQDYFKHYYDETALRVPNVISADKRLLIMEYVAGGRPDDLEFIDKHNISRAELSACFAHIFNNMIFTPGVGLHCDPHSGNIAILPLGDKKKSRHGHNFEIVLYDHGLYRDVPTDIRRYYAHFWLALINRNEPEMRKYAKLFANVSDEDFLLFAAAITGRDFDNAVNNVVSKRSKKEIQKMSLKVQSGAFLSQIMRLLHGIPRIVLLILKTNDLTRNLDENLDSPRGIERTFLIMAMYCARTVYEEGKENIQQQYKNFMSFGRLLAEFQNWWTYFAVRSKLTLYDTSLYLKSFLHM